MSAQEKPYGTALDALRTLTAIAYDTATHPLLHRYALAPVLGAVGKPWIEGPAVTLQGIRLLMLLAAQEVRWHLPGVDRA